MRSRTCFALVVLLALACGVFAGQPTRADATDTPSVSADPSANEAAELLVLLSAGSTSDEVQELLRVDGVAGLIELQGMDEAGVAQDCAYALLAQEEGAHTHAVLAALRSFSFVEVAQPNYSYPLPDDALSAQPGTAEGLIAAALGDPLRYRQYYLDSVGAPAAWSLLQQTGDLAQLPAVAIIDFSFDVSHPDLAQNVLATYDAVFGDSDVSVDMSKWPNEIDHGTSVAGVVSAVANNGIGIAGTSAGAPLVCVKVFNERGREYESTSTSSILKGYQWLLNGGSSSPIDRYGIRVINMSLGGSNRSVDQALARAITKAYQRGVVSVVAAGNDTGSGVPFASFPSDLTNVVSVMALTQRDELSSYSNYNLSNADLKNIAAPGDSIFTLAHPSQTGYGTVSGTSFATPVVASVLAMEFAADPTLDAAGAVALLYETASDLGNVGWDRSFGHGKVNAEAAVRTALGPKLDEPEPEPQTPAEPDTPTGPASPEGPESPAEAETPSTPTAPQIQTGWTDLPQGGRGYRAADGSLLTGWQYLAGRWYWFDGNGVMATGWLWERGKWYYLEPSSGAMRTGWLYDDATWYYLLSSGCMARGWVCLSGTWFSFASSGAMRTGWLLEGSTWYYLGSSGALATGWRTVGGKTYLFDRSGRMVTGLVLVDGIPCLFADTGELLSWL